MGIPLEQILIQTVNGIVNGMILALVASGLTLIFGIMDVVNFAHGDLLMLGAFVGSGVFMTTGNFWASLLVAVVLIALLGAVLQITTLRPLLGRDPLTTILATFGVSLILQNYVLWQFGPVARKIQEPLTGHFSLFYLDYPWYRLVIAGLSAAIIGALWLFLKFGTYGIWIRATTQDRVMASAMGIPVPWVHTAVFAIGAGKQVVAVDDQSDYPKQAPRTTLSGFTPNVEAIAAVAAVVPRSSPIWAQVSSWSRASWTAWGRSCWAWARRLARAWGWTAESPSQ